MGGTDREGGKVQRFRALDSIRGVLALTVVIYHVRGVGHLGRLGYIQHGFLAVTFFFVLSGFVIASTYGERLADGFPLRRFLALRLGRIYPLHLAMLAVFLAWELLRLAFHLPSSGGDAPFTESNDPMWLPHNLLLLQVFAGRFTWNHPSWSIGVEWWTYIAFALLAGRLVFRRWPSLVAALLIAPVVIARLLRLHLAPGWPELIDCMANFGLGMVIWLTRRSPAWWRPAEAVAARFGTGLEIGATVLTVWMMAIFGGKLSPAIGIAFALLIAVFSLERGLLSRLLLTAPMLLLGELSYSIYMTHQFVLDRMLDGVWWLGRSWPLPIHIAHGDATLVGSAIGCDLFSLAVIAVVVPVSAWSYRRIETPARLWSRRMVNPNHSAKVTPPDPDAAF